MSAHLKAGRAEGRSEGVPKRSLSDLLWLRGGGAAGRRATWECAPSRGTWGCSEKSVGGDGVGVASHVVSVRQKLRNQKGVPN